MYVCWVCGNQLGLLIWLVCCGVLLVWYARGIMSAALPMVVRPVEVFRCCLSYPKLILA
jgi:hypothetical protein